MTWCEGKITSENHTDIQRDLDIANIYPGADICKCALVALANSHYGWSLPLRRQYNVSWWDDGDYYPIPFYDKIRYHISTERDGTIHVNVLA